jgi:hypothetical protein
MTESVSSLSLPQKLNPLNADTIRRALLKVRDRFGQPGLSIFQSSSATWKIPQTSADTRVAGGVAVGRIDLKLRKPHV